jgi:hypothetical protein
VVWHFEDTKINTLLDKNFRVIEAGFCMSNYDRTQSARSVVHVLRDYKRDGSYIHIMRQMD